MKAHFEPLVRSIHTYERFSAPQKEQELVIFLAQIYKSLRMIFLSKIDKEKRLWGVRASSSPSPVPSDLTSLVPELD